jgi:hypothetical protein
VGSIRRHLVLVDVEATELLVVPFAADGGGMGRQLPKQSVNHGCCGGLEPSHVCELAVAAIRWRPPSASSSGSWTAAAPNTNIGDPGGQAHWWFPTPKP